MRKTYLLLLLTALLSKLTAQAPITYVGTFGSSGLPDYLESPGDVVTQDFIDRIDAAVPEYQPVPDYHPSYLNSNYGASISLLQDAEVYITFIKEGAGYKNVLSYYSYDTDNPPSTPNEVDSLTVIFPNVSRTGSGGLLNPGDKVNIGSFTAGTTIAFAVFANGYNASTNTVSYGKWVHYSDKVLNPPSDPALKQHTVVLYDQITEKYVICFEDITRPSGYKDFNDAIFYSTTNPPNAAETATLPNLPLVWEGTVDSDWENPANWNPNQVPDSSSTVTISASAPNAPEVTSDLVVDELVIEPGATIDVTGDNSIGVQGDYTANATVEGEVNFVGDTDQTIYGSATFTDISVNNNNKVNVDSDISITGNLEINSGTFNTNGNDVTLISSSENTGMVIQENGVVNGDLTFQRLIDNKSGYQYISSPIQGATIADINDDFSLIGLGGTVDDSPLPNVFFYDETIISSHNIEGWMVPSNTAHPMTPGIGFAANINKGVTLDFTGTPNNGIVNIPLSFTDWGYDNENSHCPPDGWHLIGNPYPSTIDWNLVTLDKNMENAIYVWDPFYGRYNSYINGVGTNGGTSIIAPFQAFFVKTNSTLTLTLDNSIRLLNEDSTTVFYRKRKHPALRLKVTQGEKSDETVLYTCTGATKNFDRSLDACKIFSNNGESPELATSTNGKHYSINAFNTEASSEDTIGLILKPNTSGNYQIELSDACGDFSQKNVFIIDAKENKTHNLSSAPYQFFMNELEEEDRFEIHFTERTLHVFDDKESKNCQVSLLANAITINGLNHQDTSAKLTLYNSNGNKVKESNFYTGNNGRTSIAINELSVGMYNIVVQTENQTCINKLAVTR